MKLQQVQRVGGKIAQAVVHPIGQIFPPVAFHGLLGQAAPGFGGDDDFFFAPLLELGDQPLAAAVAVDVRSVDEVHPGINGLAQGAQSFFVGNLSPGAANGPSPKTDV